MGLGTGATAAIVAGIGAAGSITAGVLGSNAAGDAASTQANAANQAAALQYASGQNSLAFQDYIYQQQLQNQLPGLRTGQNALNALARGVGLTPQQTLADAATQSQGAQPNLLPPPNIGNFLNNGTPSGNPSGGTADPANGPGRSIDAQIQQASRIADIGDGGGPLRPPIGGIPTAPALSAGPPAVTGSNPATFTNLAPWQVKQGWTTDQNGNPVAPPDMQPNGTGGDIGGGTQRGISSTTGGADQNRPLPPNGLSSPTDLSAAGALTAAYPYQFEAPAPFSGQTFQAPPGFNPPPSFSGPDPFSAKTFQGGPAPYSGQTFQAPPGFVAPDAVTEQNDPGYKFRLQQGLDAMQSSAAARGDLFTGGTEKALNDYAQNYASGEYQNVFGRALTEQQNAYNQAASTSQIGFGQGLSEEQNAYNQAYGTSQLGFGQGLNEQQNAFNQALAGQQTNYQQALSTQQNAFNQALSGNAQQFGQNLSGYQTNYQNALQNYQQNYNQFQNAQANAFNRYAALAGVGQTAAGQLNSAGANAGQNVGNTLTGTASAIGQQLNNAAAAQASGIVGGANTLGGAFSGIGGNISNLLLLSQILGKH